MSVWRHLYGKDAHDFQVTTDDGSWMRFAGVVDPLQKTITLTSKEEGDARLRYVVDADDARHVRVEGTWNAERHAGKDKAAKDDTAANASPGSIGFEMHRVEPDSFLLETRGFPWVSEYPFSQ